MPPMSYLTYKFLHLAGVIAVLMTVGGLLVGRVLAGTGEFRGRRVLSLVHGIGLLVVFIAGFGLLARLNASWPWQHWVMLKMVLWLWIGAVPALARHLPQRAQLLWWSALAAAMLAAFLASFKPF